MPEQSASDAEYEYEYDDADDHADDEPGRIADGVVHDAESPRRGLALGTRWLGVGLAACIAVVTLGLAVTGRIGLYVNPDASWWAVSMSIVVLLGAIASCAVPISGHHHGHDPADATPDDHDHDHDELPPRAPAAVVLTVIGGVAASVFVVAALALPPASLSAELALARSSGVPPQLASSATLALASSGDTSDFGIGEWSAVAATTTDPSAFAGDAATLEGFVGPGATDDGFALTRLVIVHCVIDAQAASVAVAAPGWSEDLAVGQWVQVAGAFAQDASGSLVFEPASITPIDEPGDPYEY